MPDAVIVSAVRTAVGRGKKDGSLAGVHPIDLSAIVIHRRGTQATMTSLRWEALEAHARHRVERQERGDEVA